MGTKDGHDAEHPLRVRRYYFLATTQVCESILGCRFAGEARFVVTGLGRPAGYTQPLNGRLDFQGNTVV